MQEASGPDETFLMHLCSLAQVGDWLAWESQRGCCSTFFMLDGKLCMRTWPGLASRPWSAEQEHVTLGKSNGATNLAVSSRMTLGAASRLPSAGATSMIQIAIKSNSLLINHRQDNGMRVSHVGCKFEAQPISSHRWGHTSSRAYWPSLRRSCSC